MKGGAPFEVLAKLMVMREREDKPMSVPTNVGPGTILSKRFRLIKPIGSGGMAVVWLAEHLVLGIPVALKMLRSMDAHSSVARARFEKEARTVATLKHPNVVHILEYGVHAGLPFFAMELLEGETLAKRLHREKTLSFATTVWLTEQLARPVDKAHAKGIVHRDIKPDNIFLQFTEDGEVPKLLDFGIAKLIDGEAKDTLTRTDAVIGTTHYLSPERARGKKSLDGRVDLWALAIVVFECIIGQRPFDEHADDLLQLLKSIAEVDYPPPSTLRPTPPEFDAWTDQALNPNPNRRFESATEMAQALREALLPGTVASLTGMAFDSLEREMLDPSDPATATSAPQVNEPKEPRALSLPSINDLPSLLLDTPESDPVEEPTLAGPQLRRFDLSTNLYSVEIEPTSYPADCAVLDEKTTVNAVVSTKPEETTTVVRVEEKTRIETHLGTATLVDRPVFLKERAPKRDLRLYAVAAISLLLASGLGFSMVRLMGSRLQGARLMPTTDTSFAVVTPPIPDPSTHPAPNLASEPGTAISVSLPSPAISVAPPIVDVERLPIPDLETSSPAPTQASPPVRRTKPTGTVRKPHEVFGL